MYDRFIIFRTALTPIVWGTTYAITTAWLPVNHPMTAGMLRALPAGLILLGITRVLPQGTWWWRSAILGTLNIGVFFGLLFIAAEALPGGVAAILVAVAPLIAIIISPLILHQYPTLRQIIGVALAFLGVCAIAFTPGVTLNITGVLAGLGAAVSMGCGMVLAKKWGQPPQLRPLHTTAWQLCFGGFVLLPFALLEGPMPDLDWVGVGGYAYLCIFGALLAYPNQFAGLARLDVTTVLLLGALSPVTAVLIDAISGNPPTLVQFIGIMVVLAAIMLAQRLKPQFYQQHKEK